MLLEDVKATVRMLSTFEHETAFKRFKAVFTPHDKDAELGRVT